MMRINNVNINIISLLLSYVLIGEADFKLNQSHSSHNTTSLCVFLFTDTNIYAANV